MQHECEEDGEIVFLQIPITFEEYKKGVNEIIDKYQDQEDVLNANLKN